MVRKQHLRPVSFEVIPSGSRFIIRTNSLSSKSKDLAIILFVTALDLYIIRP